MLPSPWILLAFLASLIGVGFVAYGEGKDTVRMEWAAAEKAEQLAETQAGAKLQFDVDQAAIAAGGAEAVVQEKIVTKYVTLTKEIPTYVPDTSNCITLGLVRVLNAAAIGEDPAALDLAPGQFNETCADIGSRVLAENIVGNYGKHHANAAQLTGLQGYVLELKAKFAQQAK